MISRHCTTIIIFLLLKANVYSNFEEIHSETSISNTLYLGIDNIITISPSILTDTSFIIVTDNGRLIIDSNKITIIPRKLPVARIQIYKKTETDTTLFSSKRFQVKYVPQPRLMIGNEKIKNNSTVKKETILNTSGLQIFLSEDIVGSNDWFSINRFSIGYGSGAVYKSIDAYNHLFTEEMKEFVKNLHPGQQINIKVKIESKGNMIKNMPIYSIRIL